MYSIDILIGTGLCALIVGGLLGMLFGRKSTAGSQQARELEKRIDQLTRDKQAYENRVTEHFVETADRLNALTDMYRGIHEHLAEGASTLCVGKNDVSVKRLGGTGDDSEVPQDAMNIEPPRDYAPKNEGETGMLNESFGIEREPTPGAGQNLADADEAEDVREEASAGTGEGENESEKESERKENA
ncbi:MAG: Z-ring associated ZapG family protein [Pseudohaliea sp.]